MVRVPTRRARVVTARGAPSASVDVAITRGCEDALPRRLVFPTNERRVRDHGRAWRNTHDVHESGLVVESLGRARDREANRRARDRGVTA